MRASHPGAQRRLASFLRFWPVGVGLRRTFAPALGLATILLLPASLCAQGVTYAPGAVDLGSTTIGGAPTSAGLSFTITGDQPVVVASVTATTLGSINEDFNVTSQNCVGTLAPSANCNITVSFLATAPGVRNGAVTLFDSSGNHLASVVVHGLGSGSELVFAPAIATTITAAASLTPSTFQTSAAVYDGAGDLFFNDFLNDRILEMSAAGAYSVLATGVPGSSPSSMAIAPNGNIFLTSPATATVYVITAAGVVRALDYAGVTLKQPTGVALDSNGYLYVADATANTIIRSNRNGKAAAALPITGLAKPLSGPIGLVIGADGALYVVDSNNARIVRIDLTTYAATPLALNNITLFQPYGITSDPAGNFYVADAGNNRVVMISPTGDGELLNLTTSPFLTPTGVTIAATGDLAVADNAQGLILVSRSTTNVTFPTITPVDTLDTADGTETFTVQNIGNATSQLTVPPGSSINPTISTNAFAVASGTCPVVTSTTPPSSAQLTVDASCTYGISFTPTVVGTNTADLLLSSSIIGALTTTTQTVTLNGNAGPSTFALSIVAAPSTVVLGNTVGLTVSAGGANPAGYRGTITFTSTDPGATINPTSYTFTAADAGTHTFPNAVLFSQTGVFTVSITDGTNSATSNPVTVTNTLAPSMTTLTAAPNPAFVNQTVTLTATVAPSTGTGVPTGSINFFDGTTQIGTANLANGTASLPVTFTTSGAHNLTAVYSSDTTYAASTSPIFVETINGLATTTTLTAAPNPAAVNASVTLTATVAPATGTGVPTGSVNFFDGATQIGTAALVNGTAILSVTFTTSGAHNLTAVYSSDTTYAASTSAIFVETINGLASVTTLIATPNPAFINASVSLTATVAPATGTGVPTGSVNFFDGATQIGTANLINGTATLNVSFATAGAHNLTAVYSSDTTYAASTSAIFIETINGLATVTTMTAAPNPAMVNASVTLSATVAPATGTGVPTGSITFFDGATQIGMAALVNGTATLPVTFSTIGAHNLTAVYSSDTTYAASTSAIFIETITGIATATTLTAAPNPAFVNDSVTLTATVASTSGTGVPTGSVNFFDGATQIGTAALVNGTATLPVTFSTSGAHNLTAVYASAGNYAASTSPVFVESINGLVTATVMTASPNPAQVNATVTLSATVMPTTGTGVPTGGVTFFDGLTFIGTATLVNGSATLPTTFSTAGPHNLTAVYSSDTMFAASTSPIYVETILAAGGAATITTLTAAPNPAFVGDQVTLTAMASSTTAGTLSGTIAFFDGATPLGTQPIVNGAVSINVTFNTPGNHNLTAVYSGDTNFATSTSIIYVEVINPAAPTTTMMTASPNPAQIGATVTLSATVVLNSSGTASPTTTGSITFFDGGTPLGFGVVTNGQASLAVSFSTGGPHTLTAVYASTNTEVAGSTSLPYVEVINAQLPTATLLTASPTTTLVNGPVTLSATVTAAAGTPDGTVTFFAGGTPLGTAAVVNGTATLTTSFGTYGSLSLTAMYSGSTGFTASPSNIVTETVEDIYFNLATAGSGTVSVLPGKSASYLFTVNPVGGNNFIAPITFTVTGQPTGSIVTFTPTSIDTGAAATTVTLSVTPPAMAQLHHETFPWQRTAPVFSALLLLPLALFKRRRRLASLLLLFVMAAATLGLTGCLTDQASGYFGQAPKTYNLTVTATSGPVTHTVNVTLVVE